MFNNSELSRSTLAPFTPRNTSRRSISSPGQSGRLFPRSSRSSAQSRSFSIPARVIDETPLHRVETYGLALPVQVNEIIAAAKERTPVSVHLDPSGWAWLVFERRLLVWRYQSTEKSKATFCKEFVLPPTELYHSAKLVCLVGTAGVDSRQFGVLAVSPEGLVCYWPSMMYESSPVETQTELIGQEFHSLVEFQPHGYILSTTTNDILLLSIQKKSIAFHRFRLPGGVFSGFGRRMSSFIFGAEDSSSSVLRKIVVERSTHGSSRSFYALSGNTLRKWSVESHGSGVVTEKIEADWNVGALFEQQTSQRFQVDLDKVKSFCIDAQQSSSGVSVLSAMLVQNPELDEARMYYFLGTIDVNEDSDTYGRVISFVQLRFAEEYKEELHQQLVDFRLLIPATSRHAFLYSDNIIVCFAIKTTDDVLNKVEFVAEEDVIWGSGFSEDAALFFVRKHGIVNIIATTDTDTASDAERVVTSQRPSDASVQEDRVGRGDNLATLRAAFLQFCQGNKEQAQTVCEDQFEDVTQMEDVSNLDSAVVNVSREIVDDYPASDPRWAEAVPADSGSSSASLIIIHQLEDKLKAHDYFVQFLKEVMLFQKLSTIQQFGRAVNTRHLLCGHAEKLKFAIALRRQHNKYQELVDGAIELIMKHRDQESAPKGLTQQDLFYREVSRISEIISGLLDYEKHKLSQQPTQQDYQEIILSVNSILESSLQEAWQYRQVNDELYTSSRDNEIIVEYLPWTASNGPEGIRTLLLEQLEILRERALNLAEDQKTKAVLVQQLVNLADILLDGYVTQLDSLSRNFDDQARFAETTQKYEHDRHQVIYPLVSRGYLEEALSLAEKYRDFDILIEVCEDLQDQNKLQHYMNLFKDENFSDFAFKWYMDRGKRSRLMSQPTNQHENLSKFLSSHDHLKWLHDIERQSFYQAFDTLKDLACKEELYLERKKTLLSLAKLALLASDESDEDEAVQILEDITNQQTLITHQESVRDEVLQSVSLDPTQMPPLSPEQLIELYISDVNKNRDESDFKKALDVLHIAYMDEAQRDEYEALRLKIWSQAILVDDWANAQTDDPLSVARNTVFFKTVEIAFHEGFDLTLYMPSLESFLNCEDLKTAGLTDNATFQFLLRAGYEQILRTQNEIDME